MQHFFSKLSRTVLWTLPLAAYFIFAQVASAAYISPSGSVYPGASYSVNETVTNSGASAITVHNDWFYKVNGGGWNSWCSQDNTVEPNSSRTVSCSSTGDVAGTVMEFQVNTWWNPWTVTWSNTGFTVQARPVASASLNGQSPVSYGSGTYLTWNSSNTSSCTLTNFGSVPTNNAGPNYYTGNLTGDKTFTLSCSPNSGATGSPTSSVTIKVNPPPVVTYSLSISTSGSGSVLCNGNSCASSYQSGTVLTLTAPPSSGYSFGGWGGDCSGTGSCALTMNGNKSVSTSFNSIPVNVFSVQATLDGSPYSVTISQVGGSPYGMGGTTLSGNPSYYTRSTTDNIDVTLRAPSVSGSYFSGWSGCSSVSANDCRIVVSGGGSASVQARYLSPSALPNLTVSVATKGAVKADGGGYLATRLGVSTETYLIATVANSGGGPAYAPFRVDLVFRNNTDGTVYTGGADINGLSNGASKKVSVSHALYAGTWTLTALVDGGNAVSGGGAVTEGSENDNTASTQVILSNELPPSPMPYCEALFNNVIGIDSAGAWTTNVSGSIQGCPSARYRGLRVSGSADDSVPLSSTFSQVFDLAQGLFRVISASEISTMCSADHQAIEGSSGSNSCGGDLQFGDITGLTSGSSFSALYRNRNFPSNYLFEAQKLPWGNYPFYIQNFFEGEYACLLGGTQTLYHAVCDSKNVDYNPSGCATAVETQVAVGQDWRAFARPDNAVSTQITFCAIEPANREGQNENAYFDMQCTPYSPDRATVSIDCGSYTAIGIAAIPTPTVSIPSQTPRPIFPPPTNPNGHWLKVQSTRDASPAQGVSITQVSVTPSTFTANYFAGVTNYERFADKNYTVVLEAPQNHPQGGTLDTNAPWTGCDKVSSGTAGGKRCTVSFAFTTSGRQERTVVANYTSALAAPELLTNTPLCTDGEGKVQVWAKAAVSGATSYTLHRDSASSSFTPSSANKIADFISASLPTTQTGAFVDKGLTPKSNYYYKMLASGSGGRASPASAATQDDASKRCPDLIVQSITLPNSPGLPAGTVLSGSTGHTISAVIKNVGEGTEIPFDNLFFVNSVQLGFKKGITGGLAQNGIGSITSDTWNAPTVTTNTTRTIEVCADQPPAAPANVQEAPPEGITSNFTFANNPGETNNCASTNTTITRTITIVPSITVKLQCEQAGGTFKNDYCVIDYANTSKLRWTVTGNPTSCAGKTGTDLTGAVTPQSYNVSGNPFSLTNLLNKLSFQYQLECTR